VNIVKLLAGTPSIGWGVTAIVLGVLNGTGSTFLLAGELHPGSSRLSILGFVFGASLAYVGARNVRDAKRMAPPSPAPPNVALDAGGLGPLPAPSATEPSPPEGPPPAA